jgi:trimethylamine:corrinoid methyltransferase-like protein
MLRWAEYGVPITILSMAMGGASTPVTLLELAGQGKFN